jgi:translation initiation factor 1A
MPKNKGKGGKNRRRGKNESEEKREVVLKSEGQEYGQVLRMLGNGRLEAFCFDGKKRLCHIRGKMRKKVWVNVGDIILCDLREYQDDKADIIVRYNPDEARQLKKLGHLPDSIKLETGENKENHDDVPFDFTNAGEEESDSASVEEQDPRRGVMPDSDSEEEGLVGREDIDLDNL